MWSFLTVSRGGRLDRFSEPNQLRLRIFLFTGGTTLGVLGIIVITALPIGMTTLHSTALIAAFYLIPMAVSIAACRIYSSFVNHGGVVSSLRSPFVLCPLAALIIVSLLIFAVLILSSLSRPIGVVFAFFIPSLSAVITAETVIKLRFWPTIKRLEESLQVVEQYRENQQLSNPLVDDTPLTQLIKEFAPLSYESNVDFSDDKEILIVALDYYKRLGNVNLESEFSIDTAVQQLTPEFPTSISELRTDHTTINRKAKAIETISHQTRQLESLQNSTCQPIITEVSNLINQQLSNIHSTDDVENYRVAIDQLEEICSIRQQVTLQMERRSLDTPAIKDLAEQAIIDPESNRFRIDACQKLLNAYETVSDAKEERLSSQTAEHLMDILSRTDPLTSPQVTIEVSHHTCDAISILTDLRRIDRSYLDDAIDTFERTLIEELDSRSLDESRVARYEKLIEDVSALANFMKKNANHPLVDTSEWKQELIRAVEEGYPKRLSPFLKQRERMMENFWEREDLYTFDWEEFEYLVGTLFQAEGYNVEVTEGTRDLGVDVWATRGNQTIAIQVKQFSEGNTVGREILQKLASTLAKGSADKVIVVTSSSFAGTAEEYARDFGPEMELIDGEALLRRLINSEVPPPPSSPQQMQRSQEVSVEAE